MLEENKTTESLQQNQIPKLTDLKSLTQEDLDSDYIVDIQNGKPGLDDRNAKYRIVGAVTDKAIYQRGTTSKNIAPAIGYKIEEIETGATIMVSKELGIQICRLFGMKNAYITVRPKNKKDEDGTTIQSTSLMYLYPHPPQLESFTQDDRVVTVFKLDNDGGIQKPLELAIKEEDCTEEFWRVVEFIYKKKNKQPKRARRNRDVEYKHKKLMENIKKELQKQKTIKTGDIFKK